MHAFYLQMIWNLIMLKICNEVTVLNNTSNPFNIPEVEVKWSVRLAIKLWSLRCYQQYQSKSKSHSIIMLHKYSRFSFLAFKLKPQ